MGGKSRIRILATGGTIAGSAESAQKISGYKAGVFTFQEMLDAVPGIRDLADITGEQFAQIDSCNVTIDMWLSLSKIINNIFEEDEADGVVIIHGTDTLEETAYFLNLTVKSDRPVVLVGAMRPATAMSADGPLNLYNAVLTAINKETYGKGVVVSVNDKIFAARDVIKHSCYGTDAFTGTDYGCIGTVHGGEVRYAYQSVKKHTEDGVFDVRELNSLPKVEIVSLYGEADPKIFEWSLEHSDGVVISATGNGSLDKKIKSVLENTMFDSVVVRSSRTVNGTVLRNGGVKDDRLNTIVSGDLSPQKSRILLMLALTVSDDRSEIQRLFYEY